MRASRLGIERTKALLAIPVLLAASIGGVWLMRDARNVGAAPTDTATVTGTATSTASVTPTSTPTVAPASAGDTLAVDAIPGGGLDATVSVPIGTSFSVDIVLSAAPDPYMAYQADLSYDSSIVSGDPVVYWTNPIVTHIGDTFFCAAAMGPLPSLFGGCFRDTGSSTATGVALTWSLHCDQLGTSPLHLRTVAEEGINSGTSFELANQDVADAVTIDASVTCADLDSDGDGCVDRKELGVIHTLGGQRDPSNPYDFYDVPAPALRKNHGGTRDGAVGVTTDVVALLAYAGLSSTRPDYLADYDANGIADGLQYDRSLSTTPGEPWRSGPPDGGVGMTTDVVAMLAQVGDSCAP